MAAVSADDVWAVGEQTQGHSSQALIEHWDGQRWSHADASQAGPDSSLADVSAVSTDDVWAVGRITGAGGSDGKLIMHWDGTAWHRLGADAGQHINGSLDGGPYGNQLDRWLGGVAAVSATDAWAVGERDRRGACRRP